MSIQSNSVLRSVNNVGVRPVTDASNRPVWTAVSENARGQLTGAAKGGRSITYGCDDRGLPASIQSESIVDMEYNFNARGNLEYRMDNRISQKESFQYDDLNRLKSWSVLPVMQIGEVTQVQNLAIGDINPTYPGSNQFYNLTYNSAGNIENKSDLGDYTMTYGENGKPHALTSISGIPSNFPAAGLNVTYTDFKKIKTLSEDSKYYELTYGVDDQRRKSVYKVNNTTR
ncbi:MAG: hypothetical protein PHH37_01455 [Paludibacter sp.]|nr:hypothetical protein [Paludibacter sp.]